MNGQILFTGENKKIYFKILPAEFITQHAKSAKEVIFLLYQHSYT